MRFRGVKHNNRLVAHQFIGNVIENKCFNKFKKKKIYKQTQFVFKLRLCVNRVTLRISH